MGRYVLKGVQSMELKKIALLAIIGLTSFASTAQTEAERSLSVELTKAVNEINGSAPQKLDEETRRRN